MNLKKKNKNYIKSASSNANAKQIETNLPCISLSTQNDLPHWPWGARYKTAIFLLGCPLEQALESSVQLQSGSVYSLFR